MNEVCGVCWGQARDLSFYVPEGPQERPQHIVLPNIRRAAETPRHCIFQEFMEPERNVVPEETSRMDWLGINTSYQEELVFAPYIDRKQIMHTCILLKYSLNSFTSTHIEEIIFILMEGLNNISYENIQNYPDNQVHYFIGINKQQH